MHHLPSQLLLRRGRSQSYPLQGLLVSGDHLHHGMRRVSNPHLPGMPLVPQRNVELGLWWVVSWHLYQVQCMPQGEFPPGRVLSPGRYKVHWDFLHNAEHIRVQRTLLQHQRRKRRGKVRNVPHRVAGIWVGLYPVSQRPVL